MNQETPLPDQEIQGEFKDPTEVKRPSRPSAKQRRSKRRAIKDRFRQYKQSQKCKTCGESHYACLEFHHLDPSKKELSVAEMADKQNWKELMAEIRKCEVLCANCHRKFHWNERYGKRFSNDIQKD